MRRESVSMVALAVLLSLVALAPVAYMAWRSLPPKVVTVDLQRLLEEEQQRIGQAAQDAGTDGGAGQRAAQEERTVRFARRLSADVDALGARCGCIIVNKAALLGGVAPDYTDLLRERMRQ